MNDHHQSALLQVRAVPLRCALLAAVLTTMSCGPLYQQSLMPQNRQAVFYDYRLSIDPAHDSLFYVALSVPRLSASDSIFQFAVQAPGCYMPINCGRFVRDFRATGHGGREIPVAASGQNSWILSAPDSVELITYRVVGHRDYDSNATDLGPSCGALLASDHAVLNTFAVCGYLRGLESKPFRVKIDCPESWTVTCPLPPDVEGAHYAGTFAQLADAPILAGTLTHDAFRSGTSTFFTACYTPLSRSEARKMRTALRASIDDFSYFMEGFLPREYWFLVSADSAAGTRSGGLEHRTSSLYSLIQSDRDYILRTMPYMARHELFHTVVPLWLRGNQIDSFRFDTLNPTTNLWFYEGVTEWATAKMRLARRSIDYTGFLAVLRNHLLSSRFLPPDSGASDSSLSALSAATVDKPGVERFSVFYLRGMVVATLLDIKILEATDGKYGLRGLVRRMSRDYRPGTPFRDEDLISMVGSQSSAEVAEFLRRAVTTSEPLPIRETMLAIGMRYEERKRRTGVSSDLGLVLWPGRDNRLVIRSIEPEALRFDFEPGDTVVAIDNIPVTQDGVNEVLSTYVTQSPGTRYAMKVMRKGVLWTVQAATVEAFQRDAFTIAPALNQRQVELFAAWASGK